MILFLCNYKAPCAGPGCLINGGDCEHTACLEYARNFRRIDYADVFTDYIEQEYKDAN